MAHTAGVRLLPLETHLVQFDLGDSDRLGVMDLLDDFGKPLRRASSGRRLQPLHPRTVRGTVWLRQKANPAVSATNRDSPVDSGQ